MNLQEILNTIRDHASDMYQDRIPEALSLIVFNISCKFINITLLLF